MHTDDANELIKELNPGSFAELLPERPLSTTPPEQFVA